MRYGFRKGSSVRMADLLVAKVRTFLHCSTAFGMCKRLTGSARDGRIRKTGRGFHGALVMLVLLVCACSLFCELFQRRLEEVVPLAACAIVLLMYGFALAGLLRAGALVALGLCAASLPAALILAVKRRGLRALLGRLLTPAALIYVLLVPGVAGSERGKPVHTWDEFTYWADAVKIMNAAAVLPADAAARSLLRPIRRRCPCGSISPRRSTGCWAAGLTRDCCSPATSA